LSRSITQLANDVVRFFGVELLDFHGRTRNLWICWWLIVIWRRSVISRGCWWSSFTFPFSWVQKIQELVSRLVIMSSELLVLTDNPNTYILKRQGKKERNIGLLV
jgi:hypothetical protein